MGAAGYGAAAGLSLAGGVYGALAADATGTYNKAMSEYDARQLDDLAKDAIARGENEAQRLGTEAKQLLGEQRAAIAGQGIDLSVGTAQDIQKETLALTARDLRTVRLNAASEARGIRVQAASTRANGRMAQRTGSNQAVGSLLTGGAQAISLAAQGVDSYRSRNPRPVTPAAKA